MGSIVQFLDFLTLTAGIPNLDEAAWTTLRAGDVAIRTTLRAGDVAIRTTLRAVAGFTIAEIQFHAKPERDRWMSRKYDSFANTRFLAVQIASTNH